MDPGVGVLTGYHVADGASRFIAVEGTRDAAARIVDVASLVRDAAEPVTLRVGRSPRALVNTDLTYASRLWGRSARIFGP